MGRPVLNEFLQGFAFWLMDLGPTDLFNLPLLTPHFGFQSISAPEIQLETTEIVEANWFFPRKVIKRGNVSNITLTRGISFTDADFWRWINYAITGSTYAGLPSPPFGGPTYRRHLLLIQYYSHLFYPSAIGENGNLLAQAQASAVNLGLYAAASAMAGVNMSVTASVSFADAAFMGNVGPFEFAARIPARCFLLKDCIPVRYKAASDFDSTNSAISIAELELAVDVFEEISLTA